MNRSWTGRWLVVLIGLIVNSGEIQAQVNSWNSDTGGNWDLASSWSLGIPPGSGQSVFFTNAYWKAVVIDSSTVSSAAQSLAVNSLTITSVSPTNGVYTTRNTLLLNYAGAGNPLVIGVDTNTPGSLIIGDTNSALVMFSSGLIVNNALGTNNSHLGEFEVGGTFSQSDNSEVVAGFLHLTGTYNFTNGEVFVGTQFINGTFNQQGGTNTGSLIFTENGVYNLFDGLLQGGVELDGPFGGVFNQSGGTNIGTMGLDGPGIYQLSGGLLVPGDLQVGPAALLPTSLGAGEVVQAGGTNHAGNITMGVGNYSLQGGLLTASNLTLSPTSSRFGSAGSTFSQGGGLFISGGVSMNGSQDVLFGSKTSTYQFNGGVLETPVITMNFASFFHSLGTNTVGTLSMSNNSGYTFNGGLLTFDQIQMNGGAAFLDNGGTMAGMRNLTMANGSSWNESRAAAQIGQLQISGGSNFLSLQASPLVIQFADSSSVPWASDGILTISNWSGSLSGGGAQQTLFGASASGLTLQQLSQVRFFNPAGLPAGTYGAKILSTGEVIPDQSSSSSGPVNSWIKLSSGNWDDASSWSLGVLPNSSQSVLIVNTNWKAVAINPSTPINFPGSMTVSNLFIQGDTNTENTLLLNNFGTNVPLTILNSVLLKDGAQILNFNSGLVLQGASEISNSVVIQDGGFIRATNGMTLSGSQLHITNGVFEASSVELGFPVSAHFSQYGGTALISNMGFGSYIQGTNDNGISLYGGTLELPGGMFLLGDAGGLSYFQAGGTNRTTQVNLEPNYGGWIGGFTLNGGLLADSGFEMMPGYETPIAVVQNGGSHVITNTLLLLGGATHGISDPTVYHLNGGTLAAGMIELDADGGDTSFVQSNATTTAGTIYTHSFGYYSSFNTTITLAGGTLSCSNFTTVDGGGSLNQGGGALIVSNLLDFGGSRDIGPYNIYARYTFAGGTLTASNINISGDWIIADGTNRISNPGTIKLWHTTTVSNVVEQFGRFILPANSSIYLSGSAAWLKFANSSGETWTNGATFDIFNWNGNPNGGGPTQVKFGTDQSGLTVAQLNQIRFHIATNLYSAKILNTGEVVPDQQIAAAITFSQQGNQLTLSWPAGYTLQSSPSPTGPFQNVLDPFQVTPPYTVNMNQQQYYYRIVPQ